jgi:hypothetical protein
VTYICRLFADKSCTKILQKASQNTRHNFVTADKGSLFSVTVTKCGTWDIKDEEITEKVKFTPKLKNRDIHGKFSSILFPKTYFYEKKFVFHFFTWNAESF